MKTKEYALYRGDAFITLGTMKEIAEFQGISINTLRFYGSKLYAQRTSERTSYRLICLD